MKNLVGDIKANGILEPIQYVEHSGAKYIVGGNHRFFAAQKLGIGQVPVQQVQLPFAGYKTSADLILTGKQPVWWQYFKP